MIEKKSTAPIRVMLIDDEPAFTRTLKLNLDEHKGITAIQVNESPKALEVALDFRPDIIFLDIVMPEADGGDVATQLRSDSRVKDTPIVFLSAIVPKRHSGDGSYTSGGERLLAKPVTVDQIIKCIHRVLDEERTRKSGI